MSALTAPDSTSLRRDVDRLVMTTLGLCVVMSHRRAVF
jgi:hypothetical protein